MPQYRIEFILASHLTAITSNRVLPVCRPTFGPIFRMHNPISTVDAHLACRCTQKLRSITMLLSSSLPRTASNRLIKVTYFHSSGKSYKWSRFTGLFRFSSQT